MAGDREVIERELWPRASIGQLPTSTLASPYGDPELALIAAEVAPAIEVPEHAWADPDARAEALAAISCLHPLDRILMSMQAHGWGQEQMASVVGIAQPSVCQRLRRLHRWLRSVVPVRVAYVEEATEPVTVPDLPRQAWASVVWQHRSVAETARALGLKRKQALAAFEFVIRRAPQGGPVAELGSMVRADLGSWKRPSCNPSVAAWLRDD